MLSGASLKHISRRSQNEPHSNDVAENVKFCSRMFTLRVCIAFISLLTLIFPVVMSDNSCLPDYWCVITGTDDPCCFYSSQMAAVGQTCSCIDYQHNFTVCLNNVSMPFVNF